MRINKSTTPEKIEFRTISFISGSTVHELGFTQINAEEANNLDGTPTFSTSGLLKTFYYLYGTKDGGIKFSVVPPTLSTRSAFVSGTQSYLLADSIQVIVNVNDKLKITLDKGDAVNETVHICTIPAATYAMRTLTDKILDDANWDNGRAPIQVFDYGQSSTSSSRFFGLAGIEKPGVNQSIQLEPIANDAYSILGWKSSESITKTGTVDTFIMSLFRHDDTLKFLPINVSNKITIYEGRSAGNLSSALRILKFIKSGEAPGDGENNTAEALNVDIAYFAPLTAKFINLMMVSTEPLDFSITSRVSGSDVSLTAKQFWTGLIPIDILRKLDFKAGTRTSASDNLAIYVLGFVE